MLLQEVGRSNFFFVNSDGQRYEWPPLVAMISDNYESFPWQKFLGDFIREGTKIQVHGHYVFWNVDVNDYVSPKEGTNSEMELYKNIIVFHASRETRWERVVKCIDSFVPVGIHALVFVSPELDGRRRN